MIFVHPSTVAAILCPSPATSNPKTVGGMCYAIFRSDRGNMPLGMPIKVILKFINILHLLGICAVPYLEAIGLTFHCGANYRQSWPSLQQTPWVSTNQE